MDPSNQQEWGAASKVSALNELFPTDCPLVKQVRSDYADWYYDLPEGYIRYYKGAHTQIYEQRIVAERAYGSIPAGSVVRHINNNRADNRMVNLRVVTRAQHGLEVLGRTPAEERTCARCGKQFKVPQKRISRSITGNLYCSPTCRQFAQRKVSRPEKAELERLMLEIGNWTALGEKFGVSDNAVRKWAKHYGLNLSICDGRRKIGAAQVTR